MKLHEHREVRVTARDSVTTPFIAPDLSPVTTTALELDKGVQGWTDLDVKVPDLTGTHLPSGLIEGRIADLKVGDYVIRKAPAKRAVRHPRPTVRRWK